MTSLVIEEGCLPSLLDSCNSSKNIKNTVTGFFIGHYIDETDIIVHFVRLSDKFRYDPLSVGAVLPEVFGIFLEIFIRDINLLVFLKYQEADQHDKSAKLPTQKIDEEAAILHAKHIYRMLPGGTTILGCFILADKKQLLESQVLSK